MMPQTDDQKKQFRALSIAAWAMMVGAPLIFLVVAMAVKVPPQQGGQIDMLLYILLIVGALQPFVIPIIERAQLAQYARSAGSQMKPANLYFTLTMIKLAVIEAISMYGLIVFFLSGSIEKMLYFYPIAAVWAFVHWPTESKFEDFIRKVETRERIG